MLGNCSNALFFTTVLHGFLFHRFFFDLFPEPPSCPTGSFPSLHVIRTVRHPPFQGHRDLPFFALLQIPPSQLLNFSSPHPSDFLRWTDILAFFLQRLLFLLTVLPFKPRSPRFLSFLTGPPSFFSPPPPPPPESLTLGGNPLVSLRRITPPDGFEDSSPRAGPRCKTFFSGGWLPLQTPRVNCLPFSSAPPVPNSTCYDCLGPPLQLPLSTACGFSGNPPYKPHSPLLIFRPPFAVPPGSESLRFFAAPFVGSTVSVDPIMTFPLFPQPFFPHPRPTTVLLGTFSPAKHSQACCFFFFSSFFF